MADAKTVLELVRARMERNSAVAQLKAAFIAIGQELVAKKVSLVPLVKKMSGKKVSGAKKIVRKADGTFEVTSDIESADIDSADSSSADIDVDLVRDDNGADDDD